MSNLNWGRVLLGGLIAAVILWVLEGVASMLYLEDMQAAMTAHNLSMEMDAATWVISIFVSLLTGVGLVWLYASILPRYGAGWKTAVVAGAVLWLMAYVPSLLGYGMMGLFPNGMLVLWACVGLVEMVVAAAVGSRVYKEA